MQHLGGTSSSVAKTIWPFVLFFSQTDDSRWDSSVPNLCALTKRLLHVAEDYYFNHATFHIEK
jgi:hypothetical protein